MDNKLKWQINAETSITQLMLWVILWKLFDGWIGYLALPMILGNVFTLLRSAAKMGGNYFKVDP